MSGERSQIADALATAILIDDDPFDTEAIEIGDTITIREVDGETGRYVLVDGTVGSRAQQDWVSAASPLGAALLGRNKGDEVMVGTPGGSLGYVILGFERTSEVGMPRDGARPATQVGSDFLAAGTARPGLR